MTLTIKNDDVIRDYLNTASVQTDNVCRVDPTIKTDNVNDSPVQLAAERDYVNILSLFAEHVAENTSSGIKIRLLRLIIECEEKQDGPVEVFKKQLGDLSAFEVFNIKYERQLYY